MLFLGLHDKSCFERDGKVIRRRPYIYLATAALFILALVAGFGVWRGAAGFGPRRAAQEYMLALARGDAAAAQAVSSGEAAYAAGRLKESGVPAARAAAVKAYLAALGRGWALVEAEAELVLGDGTADAGWYRLELVKADDGWRVIDFQPAPPRLAGVGLPAWGKGAREAESVFRDYLSLLARGKYAEAAKLAVGPARAAQERGTQAFGKAPLFKEVSEVSARLLWRRGKYLALLAEYQADGWLVKVTALMCRTTQGWRIAQVSQA